MINDESVKGQTVTTPDSNTALLFEVKSFDIFNYFSKCQNIK